jgi:AraC-like DNA-binding protein/quercetin dioxygenase-like cupin family protein
MSELRQVSETGDERDRVRIRALAWDYPPGAKLPVHYHDWAQLIYASRGVMSVHTEAGAWVVPAQRAVWVPAEVRHRIDMSGAVAMRTLYLSPALEPFALRDCAVLNVAPLLRELILHAVERAPLHADVPQEARVIGMILDQLEALPAAPLAVPAPRDPRAQRAADWLRRNPSDGASLERIARRAGASKRTLERLFQRETGMSFGAWRQQVRLMQALELLAAGEPVTSVALSVGYESTSAFIARFREVLGTTPGRYYASV